eukprot:scaffold42171_cov75-Phaeocystis_antarctica.AAC.7
MLLELRGHVSGEAVKASMHHAVADVEEVDEAACRGHLAYQTLLGLDHHHCDEGGHHVRGAQTNFHVPIVHGNRLLPEALAEVRLLRCEATVGAGDRNEFIACLVVEVALILERLELARRSAGGVHSEALVAGKHKCAAPKPREAPVTIATFF